MEENNELRRGRGRPVEEGSFDRRFRFMGDEEYEYMIDALERELHENAGEILRDALETLYKFKTMR